MIFIEIAIVVCFSITLLSMIIFFLLLYKYNKEPNKQLRIHALTKLLLVLTFFLLIDGLYYSLLYLSQYRLIPEWIYPYLTETNLLIIPKLGIFISTILVTHFLMENRIEEFGNKETAFDKLLRLNAELSKRAEEMESTHETMQKKVEELEKYNEIAKMREAKMVVLIKKIEYLESKLKQ